MKLIHSDCLAALKKQPDNSVDSVVTDPPYGLSFMGKKWDYDVPSEEIWRECLRVLKPGGHLLAFAGARTQHRMAVRIEDAGFEIRDMCAWIYGQGFPKSMNLEGEHSGWGTALKPALEPITVARKPLSEKTVAANVQRWGTGAINIDGCRVGTEQTTTVRNGNSGGNGAYGRDERKLERLNPPGRFPANLMHDGSDEVLELFPITSPAKKAQRGAGINGATFKSPEYESTERGHDDNGGSAARFFYCAKASKRDRDEGCGNLPLGDPPGSKRSKPAVGRQSALGGPRHNNHPTVKPTDLMRYLCRLVTPPGGVVLDPFMGSGSTGKAAKLEGFGFIGIEREAEYVEIARARVKAVK